MSKEEEFILCLLETNGRMFCRNEIYSVSAPPVPVWWTVLLRTEGFRVESGCVVMWGVDDEDDSFFASQPLRIGSIYDLQLTKWDSDLL